MNRGRSQKAFSIISVRLIPLLRMPAFWVVTILGNSFVGFGAVLFHYFEKNLHAKPFTLLDCLSWSVGLVTTIGYGELMPVSDPGKILGIFMMIGGTLFLWSYMALLVGTLLAPDISLIESEIKGIKKESNIDDKKMDLIMQKIEEIQETLKKQKPSV